jgi:hypothetical protein
VATGWVWFERLRAGGLYALPLFARGLAAEVLPDTREESFGFLVAMTVCDEGREPENGGLPLALLSPAFLALVGCPLIAALSGCVACFPFWKRVG